MDDRAEELLKQIYFDPSNAGSYGGVDRLWQQALKLDKKVKLSSVKNFLKENDSYTIHRDIRRKFIRHSTVVPEIDWQWQADLVVMPALAKYNDGYVNILTVIDIFSKYAWAIPLKTKLGQEIVKAFKFIFTTSGRKPIKLQTDKGVEFVNIQFQKFLQSENVGFFTTNSDLKAAICERFNRTLKTRMWRYFTHNNTRRYIDVLDKLVEAYNNSKHRTIGIEPVNVTLANQSKIWKKVYKSKNKFVRKNSKPKFFVNEPVRISTAKLIFEKGYTGNWTDEIFFVDKIYQKFLPFMYRIRDNLGEILKGRFYEQELQSVRISVDKEYKIEKIIDRRKRGKKFEVLVKWLGYPDSANTWEPEENIKHLA
jgi:hypothetical protein